MLRCNHHFGNSEGRQRCTSDRRLDSGRPPDYIYKHNIRSPQ